MLFRAAGFPTLEAGEIFSPASTVPKVFGRSVRSRVRRRLRPPGLVFERRKQPRWLYVRITPTAWAWLTRSKTASAPSTWLRY